jgi:hypothetical protein
MYEPEEKYTNGWKDIKDGSIILMLRILDDC